MIQNFIILILIIILLLNLRKSYEIIQLHKRLDYILISDLVIKIQNLTANQKLNAEKDMYTIMNRIHNPLLEEWLHIIREITTDRNMYY